MNPTAPNTDRDPALVFEPVAPCSHPVSIADLLDDIEAVIKRHVILPPHAAAALAVWVLHTYTFELRDTVAYVAIESPEKRCGKSTLLSVLAAMAHKPLTASNVTVAALFRAIDTCRPALFIDEADTFLAGNATLRGIINSGNAVRTAYILRLSRPGKARRTRPIPPAPQSPPAATRQRLPAPDALLKKFSCWCPKVIAMIGHVPDSIADRSIVVRMSRKLVSEPCAPLSDLDPSAIRSQCARFAMDCAETLALCPKIRAQGLNDRAADSLDPLFVIARLAGPGWEQKLHAAAVALTGAVSPQSPGAELLLDALSVCAVYSMDKIFSSDLVAILRGGEWAQQVASGAVDYSSITEYHLAQMLRPYGIRPSAIRVGRLVCRGYVAAELREAVHRYVPAAESQRRLEELNHHSQLEAEAQNEPPPARATAAALAGALEDELTGALAAESQIGATTFSQKTIGVACGLINSLDINSVAGVADV